MIIGISAKPRRGKDAMANYLAKNYGFKVLHWADALYEEARQGHHITASISGVSESKCAVIDGKYYQDGDLADQIFRWYIAKPIMAPGFRNVSFHNSEACIAVNMDYRMTEKDGGFLQWWGTAYRRRHFGENYWIGKLEDALPKHDPQARIVIADTRFANEAAWVRKSIDGRLVRINSDQPFEDTGRDDNYISEVALDDWGDWDSVIWNDFDGTFFKAIDVLMAEWGIGRMP